VTDLAERHKNAAAVRHRAANQRDIVATANGDDAGIADRVGRAVAGEATLAALKVGIRNVQGRGDKAATGVDDAGAGDGDLIRIDAPQ